MALQFKCPSCDERFPVELTEVGNEKACPQCGAAAALPGNPLSDGYFLGDFEILGPLGAGRDGSLYLAREANTGMDVALRVPADELTGGAENTDAFLEQVAQLHAFEHPHVARILATGAIGEHCFYVMEYCGGGSLTPGRYVKHGGKPTTNLFLSMADRMGVQGLERFGDSTGRLENV